MIEYLCFVGFVLYTAIGIGICLAIGEVISSFMHKDAIVVPSLVTTVLVICFLGTLPLLYQGIYG